jgi:transposase
MLTESSRGWPPRARSPRPEPRRRRRSEEEVVPASDYRALQNQVRELQRLLAKKTLEAEVLREALEVAAGSKKRLLRSLSWSKDVSR